MLTDMEYCELFQYSVSFKFLNGFDSDLDPRSGDSESEINLVTLVTYLLGTGSVMGL